MHRHRLRRRILLQQQQSGTRVKPLASATRHVGLDDRAHQRVSEAHSLLETNQIGRGQGVGLTQHGVDVQFGQGRDVMGLGMLSHHHQGLGHSDSVWPRS